MNNDYRSPAFKKWLDKLQQESWQLELIISGFAIYALILAYEPIEIGGKTAFANGMNVSGTFWGIAAVMWSILIFNLTLHVILRGLWIGAVGLRYVSGDIDYNALKYSEKFTIYLKKNVGSFDKYIGQLEKYCSILFAISFLLIFYMISLFFLLICLFSIGYLITENTNLTENKWASLLFALSMFIFFILSIIVFIDFIGQGILKRNKWISKIYFPIYWFFGYLTLSFLYRPLVYNFLDNKFGKRLVLFLVPVYIVISLLSTISYQKSNYLKSSADSWENYTRINHYENLLNDKDNFIKIASIPSKIIEESYLKVFILFNEEIEDFIFKNNKKLKPKNDTRGVNSSFFTELKEGFNKSEEKIQGIKKSNNNELAYLKTFQEIYSINIDTTQYKNEYTITTDKHKRIGFETYLNIRDLSEGKHILRILSPPLDSTKTTQDTLVTIPFWHYKK